ncbi:nucleotidyltransferase domain-containing protein [Candidatus Pacearchaeota archaeon]|nr:nucleotidyltransferase domain-containing protein [Candidatus Pacearchaeota archaeon]
MDKNIKLFMKKLKEMSDFYRVKFVILFGSQAEGRANKMSDYDFAVYYEGNDKDRFKFMLNANFNIRFDAKVFQDLPLFIKKEVFRGKVIYAKDITFVYDIAYKTIKEFSYFKKYYYDYIKMERMK